MYHRCSLTKHSLQVNDLWIDEVVSKQRGLFCGLDFLAWRGTLKDASKRTDES
jgi:hypothetical protein